MDSTTNMDIQIIVKLSDDSAEMKATYNGFDSAIEYLEHLRRYVERLTREAALISNDDF